MARGKIRGSPGNMTSARRRTVSVTLVLATTLAGLVWRMAPLHLPYFLWKYGGSALWAADVYWLLAALLPRLRPAALALLASLVSLAVEFSRLIDSPPLQSFRLTLAGKLLLGSIFSPRNIVAYWLAIAATALIDHIAKPGRVAD